MIRDAISCRGAGSCGGLPIADSSSKEQAKEQMVRMVRHDLITVSTLLSLGCRARRRQKRTSKTQGLCLLDVPSSSAWAGVSNVVSHVRTTPMLSTLRRSSCCLHFTLCEMSRAVLSSASSHLYECAEPVTKMPLSCLTLTSKWSAARVLELVELFDGSRN